MVLQKEIRQRRLVVIGISIALLLNLAVLISLTRTPKEGKENNVETFLKEGIDKQGDKELYDEDDSSSNDDFVDDESMSGCMLVKDDNLILNEWLAYHYYAVKLRYLIVAVDPTSETSPKNIWALWRNLTDLNIVEWEDPDFLPAEFIEKGYDIDPDEISGDATKSKWHEGHEDPEQVKADIMRINNHRFRQLSFYSRCLQHMRKKRKTWVIHIDTDEYVVVNPLLRRNMNRYKNRRAGRKSIARLQTPSLKNPSAIFDFFVKGVMVDGMLKTKSNYPCVSLPRLLFGSTETSIASTKTQKVIQTDKFVLKRFESLRWKYHTVFNDTARNAQPKVIVDVSNVHPKDEMFQPKAFSIHRPSKRLCRRLDQMNLTQFQRFPLSVNHYIGSWERYFARNDTRRSQRTYDFKAHVQNGTDDDWISEWLDGFIDFVGEERSMQLLSDYTKFSDVKQKEIDAQ